MTCLAASLLFPLPLLLLTGIAADAPGQAPVRIAADAHGIRSRDSDHLLGLRIETSAASGLQVVVFGGQPSCPALVLAGTARAAIAGPLGTMAHVHPDVVVPLGSFDASGVARMELAHLPGAVGGSPIYLQAASIGPGGFWLSGLVAVPVGTPAPGPDEWCWTHQQYLANLVGGGIGPLAACALEGACDNPAARDAAIPTSSTPIKTCRLSIHVLCEDNGGNCAGTPLDPAAYVATEVARLNTNFAPWRIQFVYELNFVNSTTYRHLDPSSETRGMKSAHAISPATRLNIYFVNSGGLSFGTFPWDRNALGTQGGIVYHALSTQGILTHEVGHCLGLWHTFHGVTEVTQCGGCYEQVGRTPAAGDSTGDLCSDTNPTTSHGGCSDPAGTDPCSGNPWTATPWLNFMSYSHSCSASFTPQQAGRMHCWTTSVLTGWLDVPAAPGTPALTRIGGGQIQVAWTDNSTNEDGFRVQREKKSGPWGSTQTVATVGPDITSAIDAPGTGKFRYRVQGFNGSGSSAWSAWTQIDN